MSRAVSANGFTGCGDASARPGRRRHPAAVSASRGSPKTLEVVLLGCQTARGWPPLDPAGRRDRVSYTRPRLLPERGGRVVSTAQVLYRGRRQPDGQGRRRFACGPLPRAPNAPIVMHRRSPTRAQARSAESVALATRLEPGSERNRDLLPSIRSATESDRCVARANRRHRHPCRPCPSSKLPVGAATGAVLQTRSTRQRPLEST